MEKWKPFYNIELSMGEEHISDVDTILDMDWSVIENYAAQQAFPTDVAELFIFSFAVDTDEGEEDYVKMFSDDDIYLTSKEKLEWMMQVCEITADAMNERGV